jgi:hypothetical protein
MAIRRAYIHDTECDPVLKPTAFIPLRAWAIVMVCLAASPAAAEVMDKEPTLAEIWRAAAFLCPVAFVLGRVHPLLGVALLLMPNAARSALTEVHSRACLTNQGVSQINRLAMCTKVR